MKTKLLLACGSVMMGLISFAQNPYWTLPGNHFNAPNLTSLPVPAYTYDNPSMPNTGSPSTPLNTSADDGYDGQPSEYASNMIVRPDGEIEFFIIDGCIFDGKGHFIDRLIVNQAGGAVAQGTSEIMIIPFPGDCKKYYILSTHVLGSFSKIPYLYVLDMGLENFYAAGNTPNPENYRGQLVPYNMWDYSQPIDEITGGLYDYWDPSPGKKSNVFFAATKERADGSRLAFVTNGIGVYVFNVTTAGFTYSHYMLFSNSNFNPFNVRSELEVAELSSGNYRIAAPFYSSLPGKYQGLYTAELTPSGALVPGSVKEFYTDYYNPIGINESARFRGIEFSEDGNMLYVTRTTNIISINSLFYYDFLNPTTDLNSITLPFPLTQYAFQYSFIERGESNKLYLANGNGLYTLANMNNPLSAIVNVSTFTYNLNYEGQPLPNMLGVYSLPDQIDGMDYNALFEINLACCIDSRPYQIKEHSATSGIWNGTSNPVAPGVSTIYIQKELRIPAGQNVTIQNMTLKFAPGARLVIENGTGTGQGGKLRLMNNTVLTIDDRCSSEEMWLGVEVWGNSTAVQNNVANSTQGVFRMYGNSRIEHALVGVLVSQRNESNGEPLPFSYNTARNGGIVVVENSDFHNCHISALFQPYNVGTNNVSYFQRANFIWDGALRDPAIKPSAHIGLVQCTDIRVTASNFYQNTPGIYTNKNEWGMGIVAFNSGFSVYSSCNVILPIGTDCPDANVIRSHFKNLTNGIIVLNANAKPFVVLRNEFENCLNGVSSSTAKNQTISRNIFKIHEDNNSQTVGIYVTNGDKYKIEENNLTSMNGLPAQTYGIIIDNSGATHNEVYKNTFSDLYVGTQSQRINGDLYVPGPNDNAGGLRYNCNEFNSVIQVADIAVAVNSRIDYEQGRTGGVTQDEARNVNTARNKFSYTSGGHDILLSAGSQQVNYVHLSDPGHAPLTYTNTPPIAVYPSVQMWGSTPLYSDNKTCLTRYPPVVRVPGFPGRESALIDDLSNRMDKGKTTYFLDMISSSFGSSITYNELMDASPYLSDRVLVSCINSGMSDDKLKNILVANSQLSDYVWESLRESGRPEGLKSDMERYKDVPSAQQALYSQIKEQEILLSYAQREFLSYIIADPNITSKSDSLIKYLELCRGVDFQKMLLSEYSKAQNETRFDSLKSILSDKIPSDLIDFYELEYQLNGYASWKEAVSRNSGIITKLEEIVAMGKDYTAISMADLVLTVLSDGMVDFDILPLTFSQNQEPNKNSLSLEASGSAASVNIFPNPSDGIVHFKFSGIASKSVMVQLVDLAGKEVFNVQLNNTSGEQLDFSHLRKGAYLVNVEIDGVKTKAQLLILE